MSGVVHFTLSEAKSYQSVQINLYGGALVRWTETYSDGQNSYTVTYSSKETYVNLLKTLWKSQQSLDGKIGPGTYAMPFQFVLPETCLGSFQGSVGAISYGLYASIKNSKFHLNHNVQAPIYVSKLKDINLPRLMVPTHQSQLKQVGWGYFASKVEFSASVNHTGFCIGHNLPFTVTVKNGSSRRIKMRASIQRLCTYHAQGRTKRDKLKLAVVLSQNITSHSQFVWSVEDLVVPTVEPSFEGSDIIKMSYFLKVTAVIPWAKNSSVLIPITLGNVPLNSNN